MAHAGPRPVKHHHTWSKTSSHVDGDDRAQRQARNDRDNDATVAYIKRILCSKGPGPGSATDPAHGSRSNSLEDLLPPLTSSNAVDIQLYALIAVSLSLFVQNWYNRLTPDHQFTAQIVQIIAHCTRGLEQRLRRTDLESLLLDELPHLLSEHVTAVRIAQGPWHGQRPVLDEAMRFHALRPHLALEPVPIDHKAALAQKANEAAWCLLLVNRILPLLLPPEDLQNPCLDVLVSEIMSELVVRNGVCGKASEPWLLWDGITKLLYSLRHRDRTAPQTQASTVNRLQQFGLLATESAEFDRKDLPGDRHRRFDIAVLAFWSCVELAMTTWTLLRALAKALMQASATSTRVHRTNHGVDASNDVSKESNILITNSESVESSPIQPFEKRPIVGMQLWPCLALLASLERRMPWLTGIVALMQWLSLYGPGQICKTNSRVDRLMSSYLTEHLLNGNWLPSVLQATRSAVFPDNALAAARKLPTTDEVSKIRMDCASAIVDAMPDFVRATFFATQDLDLMREDVASELDVLADSYVNKHLIISAIELIVVRLFPELTAAGEERAAQIHGTKGR